MARLRQGLTLLLTLLVAACIEQAPVASVPTATVAAAPAPPPLPL
jgi:hypothetical protein